jgi:P pilus assembly chaperone PapD
MMVAVGSLMLISQPIMAQGLDMLVAPTRIIFDSNARSKEIVLVNRGTKTQTYNLTLENKRFSTDGEAKTVTEALGDEKFADEYVRLSAREVTLAAGESQIIRVLLRKPSDLADGEYRSHLVVRGQPDEDNALATGQPAEGVAIKLIPIYGLSLPLIIRQGALEGQISVQNAKLMPLNADGSGNIEIILNREGSRSNFVNLSVWPDATTKGTPIVFLQGLSVYAPLKERRIIVQLSQAQLAQIKGHELNITSQEVDVANQPLGQLQKVSF